LYDVKAWDDEADERDMYSVILGEESELWFPGREVTLSLCRNCYRALVGAFPPEPPAPLRRDLFIIRTLQSGLATALARALFEYCGYAVRHSGYEYTMPEWVSKMKSGDPSPAVARVRATPDLRVYDRRLNTLYEVEVKTTGKPPSPWRYRKDQLDTIRHHYPETTLMVYCQPAHDFFVKRMRAIEWDSIPVQMVEGVAFYSFDLFGTFLAPPQLFGRIRPEVYAAFLQNAGAIFQAFAAGE